MVTIGEAARRSGVGIETIRYYERTKVVEAPSRSPAGRRLYSADEIHVLRFIRRCRDLGFSLSEAKSLLGIASSTELTCADAQVVGQRHLQAIRQKICDLRQMQHSLELLMQPCQPGQRDCAMLVTLLETSKMAWAQSHKNKARG